jgi:3'-phosphoadenosine 5'-phosphosulfate sulfotransferase (PAPS reductase)/FAD synthetase
VTAPLTDAAHIPAECPDDAVFVVSVSGGKDSTACILAMREAGIDCRYVFADTGWESDVTYGYLDTLRQILGIAIDVVKRPGGMRARARHKAGFPLRRGRWCTEDLKVKPLREYFDAIERETMRPTVSIVGIRAEESSARAMMSVFEDSDQWGGFVWRPLMDWTVEEVLAIHHRHGVPVNPLYTRGHDRVGCYPCIMANKTEIRLVAEHDPDRIDEIRALEVEFSAERVRRNLAGEGNFQHLSATFFAARDARTGVMGIDDAVGWSRSKRGQLPLLPEPPDGGCFRWGMCEAPIADDEESAP